MTNTVYLGIDIGGSKTQVRMASDPHNTIKDLELNGINLHNLGVGEVKTRLRSLFQNLTTSFPPNTHIQSLVIGVPSYNTPHDQVVWQKAFRDILKDTNLIINHNIICPDMYIALRSGTESTPAMCIGVGTGANCYALDFKQHEYKAGDWGYLVGDQGSGFWIGRQIAEIAIKQLDGRLSGSHVSSPALNLSQTNGLHSLLDWMYSRDSIQHIASLSQLINHPKLKSSPEINHVIDLAINELVLTITSTHKKLKSKDSIDLVIVGGLIQESSVLRAKLTSALSQELPHLKPLFPYHPPVHGAINIATAHNQQSKYPKSVKIT